jgi:exonuclease VII small subunit
MHRSLAHLACAVLLAAAAPIALAQTVYKLIDRHGKITYAEEPPKYFDGQVIRIDIDPNANRATLAAPKPVHPTASTETKPAAAEATGAQKLEVARQRLEAARKALEDARDKPGDGDIRFIGNAGGGTRPVPTEAYEQRLANLERAVKEAEDEVRGLEKRQ